MDLERKFTAAVGVIQGLPKNGSFQPSNEMKLQFYAYYKQATQGPCKSERPGFWDIVARAKHDAWSSLGTLDRNTAMEKYIENLKQIVETMNYSADVEMFMEALGSFYEYVDEDKVVATNTTIQARAKFSQKEFRDVHKNDQILNTLVEETDDIEEMIGRYDISENNLDDEDTDSDFFKEDLIRDAPNDLDCNENIDNHEKLLEEIRLTKETLEHTKTMLDNVKKEKEKPPNIEKVCESFEGRPMNQQDIDKMLGNVDGYLLRKNEEEVVIDNLEVKSDFGFQSTAASLISSPGYLSCAEESDQEELFEDTVESYAEESSDCQEDIESENMNASVSHFNVEAKILEIEATDSVENTPHHQNSLCIELQDSGIFESSTESSSNHLPPTMSNPPQSEHVPPLKHHKRQPTNTALSHEDESDEILIVSSHSVPETILMSRASPSPTSLSLDHMNYQLHLTVDRVQRDLEHLHARVNSLETIVTLKDDQRTSRNYLSSSWWPFADLPPKTILFMVTWPILTHGVIEIVKAAVRKSRR
eukprot:TRINITY_DN15356_c0_g1_i1.p1 TRINITY_DN15356_c0_g1~~TRINITY_DN15356_c0_g1_i1.p1  ORF type:complete len:533 (-),score=131.88 TRINITY_DN15356_c0_g1_i1:427-2025(-)